MPFTLSHPAAILPLIRHPLVVPALIAGSMAPDVPVFARTQATEAVWWEPLFNQTHTHSAAGAVGVDLGYALGLMGLYLLLKRPVLALVPPLAARAGIREAGGPRPHGLGAAGALRLAHRQTGRHPTRQGQVGQRQPAQHQQPHMGDRHPEEELHRVHGWHH
ncbi:DUF4184 family protein [Streptomyces sp. NPDC003860]